VTIIRATEAQCQRTAVDAARLGGWMIYHNRPAQNSAGRWRTALQGDQGFPDLVLVHPTARLVWFVELKRKPNVLAPPQLAWADTLRAAGADYRLVWVPEGLDDFVQELVDAAPNRPPRPTMTMVIRDPLLGQQP
jgi:hypothetical protein